MAELLHIGVDGIRVNSGQFNTDYRYFREVPSSPLSRMVAGMSVKMAGGTVGVNTNVTVWSYKVGSLQIDTYGIGYPSNTTTEFAL